MNYPTYIPMQQQPTMQSMMGQGAGFSPRPMMQPQPMQPMRQMYGAPAALIRVNGRAGADAFYMGPNETAVLFDEKQPIFFFKTTDGAGYPTTETYRYEREPEPGTAPAVAYATQEEVEQLRSEISELKGVLTSGKQPVRAKGSKAAAESEE